MKGLLLVKEAGSGDRRREMQQLAQGQQLFAGSVVKLDSARSACAHDLSITACKRCDRRARLVPDQAAEARAELCVARLRVGLGEGERMSVW